MQWSILFWFLYKIPFTFLLKMPSHKQHCKIHIFFNLLYTVRKVVEGITTPLSSPSKENPKHIEEIIDLSIIPCWSSRSSRINLWPNFYNFSTYNIHNYVVMLSLIAQVYLQFSDLVLYFILFFKNFLEYSCFTMLCQFLLYSKVNQLYVYIYPLIFGFPSHLDHHSIESSFLSYAVGSQQLSILYVVSIVCRCQSQSPSLYPPLYSHM